MMQSPLDLDDIKVICIASPHGNLLGRIQACAHSQPYVAWLYTALPTAWLNIGVA